MGEEEKFLANLLVQEERNSVTRKYLLQVDTEKSGGRFFIDITNVVLAIHENRIKKDGEFYVDSNGVVFNGSGSDDWTFTD